MTDDQLQETTGGDLNLRKLAHVMYGLFALGLISGGLFGLAVLAAIVLAYMKRADAAGTVYARHFDWLIMTFWWGLLWGGLSALATYIFIGWLTGLVVLVWLLYRIARGWLALFEGRTPSPIQD
ncbi:hypothetical protein H0484_02475 [Pusillimonas sp. CC-YST705]|uniref:Transmembrane protein n=1 Tax=Mesopusillimonas faecipullorum TaxID=2755040 RepID=A0ABS8C9B2_9BURK|nr:hypothetical protein [Mesopusillimonas faecipullorum]MCB5362620.1 hypothetical protein [Mesopusillimonas faecipullorum]